MWIKKAWLPCWPLYSPQVSQQRWIWGSYRWESTQKGIHPDFETHNRHHQKSKTRVSVAPWKGLMSSKNFKKRSFRLKQGIVCWTVIPSIYKTQSKPSEPSVQLVRIDVIGTFWRATMRELYDKTWIGLHDGSFKITCYHRSLTVNLSCVLPVNSDVIRYNFCGVKYAASSVQTIVLITRNGSSVLSVLWLLYDPGSCVNEDHYQLLRNKTSQTAPLDKRAQNTMDQKSLSHVVKFKFPRISNISQGKKSVHAAPFYFNVTILMSLFTDLFTTFLTDLDLILDL